MRSQNQQLTLRRAILAFDSFVIVMLLASLCGCDDSPTPTVSNNAEPVRNQSADTQTDSNNETSTSVSTSGQGSSPIAFRTVGPESGFAFQRYDDMRGQRRILEVNGGGVAAFDLDGDGWHDLFLPNGCRLPLYEDQGATPGKLFRNLSDLQFVDVSEVSSLRQTGFGYGCTAADVDGDGFDDVYITVLGGNQLWMNNGDGTFREMAVAAGASVDRWGSSVAFADLNQDSHLDLYVANYLDESDTDPTLCPDPNSPDGYVGCSPAIIPGVSDTLLLSDGAGGYVDASAFAGLDRLAGKGLGVVICDLGDDFRPEIYVANDGEQNFLFSIALDGESGNVRLQDHALTSSTAFNENGFAQASMGIAASDLDRDGATDLFLTHFYGDTNTLYHNLQSASGWSFRDTTRRSALGPASRLKLGFGTLAADFDGDGWSDLAVANGHVDDRSWTPAPQPFRMNAQVFANAGDGTFQDVSESAGEYFSTPRLGRGMAHADLDHDGRADLVISNQLDPSVVLHNQSMTEAQPVCLRLVGTRCNRSAIGAEARILGVSPVLQQQLVGGGGFQSADTSVLTFFADGNEPVAIQVRWPDGTTDTYPDLTPGIYTLVQDARSFVNSD